MNSGSGSPSGSRSPRNTPSPRKPGCVKRVSSIKTVCKRTISSSVNGFLPACRTALPHRSNRLRGGFSPSISKLARLSASKRKLAARETILAPVCPITSFALLPRERALNSSSVFVLRMKTSKYYCKVAIEIHPPRSLSGPRPALWHLDKQLNLL